MSRGFQIRTRELSQGSRAADLRGGPRGIEKESLRVNPDGSMALTPHPETLGSALTNRYITTDYSEALLEFVTPPEDSPWGVLQFLCDIHQFVYEEIGDELLWAFSMPCSLPEESEIPLARYGDSNIGQMKTIYRRGLGYRYGRYMQVIAGLHFNYSLPDSFWETYREIEKWTSDLIQCKSDAYLGLVRNVRRLDWLLLYLFGASPIVCKSFIAGEEVNLEELDSNTYFGRYATSLRMSDLGYQNTNQASLQVSANSLDEYVRDLSTAINTPNPDYMDIGLKRDDLHLQLNANQLQIENEYYSTIRPKRVARSGERPTSALQRGGVEYVELRALDVSPFDPVGINQSQIRFLEAFLIYCLLLDSPPIEESELRDNKFNNATTAKSGREPGVELRRSGALISLKTWALEVCDQMTSVCEFLDGGSEGPYVDALRLQMLAVENVDRTPSARLIAEVGQSGMPFVPFALQVAQDYRDYFLDLAPEHNGHRSLLGSEQTESLQRQRAIEDADDVSFDAFVADYLS